jgi:hypothetical protein
MPSTDSPKRAILYARVSTDEQARSGFSLAQQLEALRVYCEQEGYEILEEVQDPGQSGASLERPGMDRVRDLVAAGGISVVLAQDRYEPSTKGETIAPKANSRTASSTSSPSSSGQRQPNAVGGGSCARCGKERSWPVRRLPTGSRSTLRETATT